MTESTPPSPRPADWSERFRTRSASLWTWLGENHTQLTLAFAIVAAIYVQFEYQSNEDEAKVKRATEYQARYGQGDVLAARVKLESYWLGETSKDDLQQAVAKTKEQKVTEVILKRTLEGSVFVIADFFDQVATCVRERLCDLKASCAIFRSSVEVLHDTYFNLFEEWKKRWGESFATSSSSYFKSNCPKK